MWQSSSSQPQRTLSTILSGVCSLDLLFGSEKGTHATQEGPGGLPWNNNTVLGVPDAHTHTPHPTLLFPRSLSSSFLSRSSSALYRTALQSLQAKETPKPRLLDSRRADQTRGRSRVAKGKSQSPGKKLLLLSRGAAIARSGPRTQDLPISI